jgi:hypothetical protein
MPDQSVNAGAIDVDHLADGREMNRAAAEPAVAPAASSVGLKKVNADTSVSDQGVDLFTSACVEKIDLCPRWTITESG